MARQLVLVLCGLWLINCSGSKANIPEKSGVVKPKAEQTIEISQRVVVGSFVGNGAQWGGYDLLESWTGASTFSNDDWNTLFSRVRFMRPGLVRLMVGSGSYMANGVFDPSKSQNVLFRILDFCQSESITVMIGEWGHQGGDSTDTSIDEKWLDNSAKFLDYLLTIKNYSCIEYYNMVNEPNGNWSSINGRYALWQNLIGQYHAKLVAKGIGSKVRIIGPDVAVWDTNLVDWLTRANDGLGVKMGAYDIHTYPDEQIVRNGDYTKMVRTYKNAAPASKEMVMGELGFKYLPASSLRIENDRRIAADRYASTDSNMFIYDGFYGIDIADAIIQCMAEGYTSSLVWMMDDAMYNMTSEGSTKLKRWGFWNILGSEKFESSSDELIRPWFYTVSLLCRYFPKGCEILQVSLPNKNGIRAIVARDGDKYTIAVVNSHLESYPNIDIVMESGVTLKGAKHYQYISGAGTSFIAKKDVNGFAEAFKSEDIDLSGSNFITIHMPAQSFYLMTNMK